jgi:rhodanese-related sulfurtransferase
MRCVGSFRDAPEAGAASFPLDVGFSGGDGRSMKALLTAAALVIAASLNSHAAGPVDLAPEAAAAWLGKTPAAQILDVRTKEEFATGHLARAVLIPWTDPDFQARAAKELDRAKPVFVYCRSGRRSSAAATALVKLGFAEVKNLEGGILAWQKAGQPITKPE